MLSFQSRFSSIEIFTLFIIAVTLYYYNRNKQISKQLDSIRKSMNQEDIEKMTDAEKKKREELEGELNQAGVISLYLMFGTLPLLILITFIHQIYLFF
jgi:hypothetical protein